MAFKDGFAAMAMVARDDNGLLDFATTMLVNVSSVFDAEVKVLNWAVSIAISKN